MTIITQKLRTLLLLSAAALLSVCCFGCGGGSGGNPSSGGGGDTGGNTTHTHTWGDWVVTTAPTCAASGVETRTCTQDASHKETRAVAKLSGAACEAHTHTWGAWVVTTAPTCDAAGVETRTCTQDASHKETRAVAKLSGLACVVSGVFIDERDGRTYKTVKIGDQTWMAENMNYQTSSGSKCYGDNPSNCDIYGRMYNWNTAMAVCPNGWHLSTMQEWTALVMSAMAVGGSSTAYSVLKSTSGWSNNGNGTDDFGFKAMPGGCWLSTGVFTFVGSYGLWWTTTEIGSDAYYFTLTYAEAGTQSNGSKADAYSVRCVQDD